MMAAEERDSAVLAARRRRISARTYRRRQERHPYNDTEAKLRALVSAIRACTDNDDDTRNMSARELFAWATNCIMRSSDGNKQHTKFIGQALDLMRSLDRVLQKEDR